MADEAGAASGSNGASTGGAAPSGAAGGSGGASTGASAGAPASQPGAQTPGTPDGGAASKSWKIKRFGQEVEFKDPDELARAASDDYEHEVAVDGSPRKVRMPDLVRDYQLAQTSRAKMEQAAKLRREVEDARARGQQEPDWYLREHLGVEDPDAWAASRVRELIRLEELKAQDPDRWRSELGKREEAQRERAARVETERQRAEESKRAQAEYLRDAQTQAQASLEAEGLGYEQETWDMYRSTMLEWMRQGTELTPQQCASLVRERFDALANARIGRLPPDRLTGWLGDERTEAIRAHLLKKLDPRPVAAPVAEPPKPEPAKPFLGTRRMSEVLRES